MLTGELWMSIVCNLEEKGYVIIGLHYIIIPMTFTVNWDIQI